MMDCTVPSGSVTPCAHSRGPATLDTMSHAATDEPRTSTAAMAARRLTVVRVAGMRRYPSVVGVLPA